MCFAADHRPPEVTVGGLVGGRRERRDGRRHQHGLRHAGDPAALRRQARGGDDLRQADRRRSKRWGDHDGRLDPIAVCGSGAQGVAPPLWLEFPYATPDVDHEVEARSRRHGPSAQAGHVEIMGPGKYENVGKSQSVLFMINLIIFPRTRRRGTWTPWCGSLSAGAPTTRRTSRTAAAACSRSRTRRWRRCAFFGAVLWLPLVRRAWAAARTATQSQRLMSRRCAMAGAAPPREAAAAPPAHAAAGGAVTRGTGACGDNGIAKM
jgi:hypothetical protein